MTGAVLRLLIGVVAASLALPGSSPAQDSVAAGAKVYTDQKCAVCHSIAGTGNPKGPLDGVGARLSAAEIRAWIVDAKGMTAKTKAPRKPEMRNHTLPKEDLDALVTYLSALKK